MKVHVNCSQCNNDLVRFVYPYTTTKNYLEHYNAR